MTHPAPFAKDTAVQGTYGQIWLRPQDMFFETVEIDGKQTPRFEKIDGDLQ